MPGPPVGRPPHGSSLNDSTRLTTGGVIFLPGDPGEADIGFCSCLPGPEGYRSTADFEDLESDGAGGYGDLGLVAGLFAEEAFGDG